jgi:hypothetical protein
MSKIEVAVVVGLVLLVAANMVHLILFSKWIDRLNEGLPPDQQFQLIGWWSPAERARARKRWKEIRSKR